jgi:glutaredoxin
MTSNSKKLTVAVILLIATSIFTVGELAKERKTPASSDNNQEAPLVLFYSVTCPHCKIVEDYLSQNNVKTKITYSEKETGNTASAQELVQKETACGTVSKDLIGAVPMLWDKSDNKCYLGQDQIIDFFKQKLQNI